MSANPCCYSMPRALLPLPDMPHLTDRLSRLEGTYIRQATEATRINERAENARLHYSEVTRKY